MTLQFLQPGKPTQDSYIERFYRTCREEVLDVYVFSCLTEVKNITDEWIEQYNLERPHESLKNLTPVEYLTENSPEVFTFSWR